MASIDKYKHQHIGFIECPSDFDFVFNNDIRRIAIYELEEDIPEDEIDFYGKTGDILLGGGSGEVPAFRIAIPEAIFFFGESEDDDFIDYDDLFRDFWTPTASYILCGGFAKMGWTPDRPIELWLTEQICMLLTEHVPKYARYKKLMRKKSLLPFMDAKPR
ncbi:hypothetical protein [Niabella sp.]|uniref:hypothetical protein n=1 Tax=Niabella sp. TaxID=1962976 RepID=UPI002625DB26|nr:hypothetical protein [Niabella sp.]